MTKKEIEKEMRSLENKIAYRTKRIAEMRDRARDSADVLRLKATSDAKKKHAELRIRQRDEDIAKTEKTWLEPLQEELAGLMQKLLDE